MNNKLEWIYELEKRYDVCNGEHFVAIRKHLVRKKN